MEREDSCDFAEIRPSIFSNYDPIVDAPIVQSTEDLQSPPPFDLAGLPKDIMFKLFELMAENKDIASMFTLGLACRSFYLILKALHPGPIPLTYEPFTIRHGQCVILTRFVVEFLGSQFRQIVFPRINMNCEFQVHFLNQKTFGTARGEVEQQFGERVSAYFRMEYWDAEAGAKIFMLPSPFGKGEAWYDEVAAIVENLDVSSLPRYAALRWKTWPSANACQRMLDDKIMSALVEWIAMIGL
ncbi:hypothetical protein BDZ45DRAFT_754727 [Acephala macrosclerotiorum]|nr:hypothetical protein BDZ45DRAFT_754727 [Acephala macrosclerotiorum]